MLFPPRTTNYPYMWCIIICCRKIEKLFKQKTILCLAWQLSSGASYINSYSLYFNVHTHINIFIIYCRHILFPISRILIKQCDFDCHTVVSHVQLQWQVIKKTDKILEVITNISKTVLTFLVPRNQFSLTFFIFFVFASL